jgi:hypothetical protein
MSLQKITYQNRLDHLAEDIKKVYKKSPLMVMKKDVIYLNIVLLQLFQAGLPQNI